MKIVAILILLHTTNILFSQDFFTGRLDQDLIVTDNTEVKNISYSVYYPADYDHSLKRQYPIIYFLSGSFDQNDWISHGEVNKLFDKLIAERKIPPFIGIMLCGAAYKSSDWNKLFENYIVKFIEQRVRTFKSEKSKRAIVGFSLGGYFALKSSTEMEKLFAGSVSFCPLYTESKNRGDVLAEILNEQRRCDALSNMLSKINNIEINSKCHQLLITSDNNFAYDDFNLLKPAIEKNPNGQIWIRNGEHDWDFAIHNLEPALEFVGDVFFGKLKMN